MMGNLFDDEDETQSDALLSDCGTYRYRLHRRWASGLECAFVMLNPSTADALLDDPTIRKCIGYAKAWGYGGLWVVNLFAYRSPDPRAMKRFSDPVGPENNQHLIEVTRGVALVVCAWGKDGSHQGRGSEVIRLLEASGVKLHILHLNVDGTPGHPLYLRGDSKPLCWRSQ